MRGLSLALILSASMACVAPPPNLSPAARTAFTADQVVQRVNELENAAIAAQAANALDLPTARIIVEFAVAADKTLKASPQGWQVTISTGWAAVKRQLPMVNNPALAAVIGTVDVAVASLGGTQ